MGRKVVITGMGIVCPIGHDVDTAWKNLLAGNSGVAETTLFDASTFPTKFCAEVKNYDFKKYIKDSEPHKNCGRNSAFTIWALVQACKQAGIELETDSPKDGIDRRRMGIYLGAGEGSIDNDNFFDAMIKSWQADKQNMDWAKWAQVAFGQMKLSIELEQEPNIPASHIAVLTGARGPARNCLTACAASTQAIGEATMMIRRGDVDCVIAGGAHSMLHPMGITGFNRLTALSTRNESPTTASRPFSASRDGFVIGEGAAILILEALESAQKRGAKVLAEIIGYGSSADAFRVTDMHESGRGGALAIANALKDAGILPQDVQYINAHGTSTAENDSIETKAIKAVFKEHAKNVAVSSCKGVMGHLIGAAGAAETICSVKALLEGVIPPTMNLNDPDPELDLDYVPNKARKADLKIVMKESFGFGGQNNVILISDLNRKKVIRRSGDQGGG
jgi:3-oxoacyl-[acyl-carrier-protein] synthase II